MSGGCFLLLGLATLLALVSPLCIPPLRLSGCHVFVSSLSGSLALARFSLASPRVWLVCFVLGFPLFFPRLSLVCCGGCLCGLSTLWSGCCERCWLLARAILAAALLLLLPQLLCAVFFWGQFRSKYTHYGVTKLDHCHCFSGIERSGMFWVCSLECLLSTTIPESQDSVLGPFSKIMGCAKAVLEVHALQFSSRSDQNRRFGRQPLKGDLMVMLSLKLCNSNCLDSRCTEQKLVRSLKILKTCKVFSRTAI